jgi:recombination protein RecT
MNGNNRGNSYGNRGGYGGRPGGNGYAARGPAPELDERTGRPKESPTQLALREQFERHGKELGEHLSGTLTPKMLVNIAINCIAGNEQLQRCEPLSIWRCIVTFAEWGLHPNPSTGLCYMVPYGNKAQPQLGYRGMIELARRSGLVTNVEARVIYQADRFKVAFGFNPVLEHVPHIGPDRGKAVGAYAQARLSISDVPHVEVMSIDEIDEIREAAPSRNSPAWVKTPDEMRRKTVVRRLMKYLSLSPELAEHLSKDADEAHDVVDAEVVEPERPPMPTAPALPASTGVRLETTPAPAREPERVERVERRDAPPPPDREEPPPPEEYGGPPDAYEEPPAPPASGDVIEGEIRAARKPEDLAPLRAKIRDVAKSDKARAARLVAVIGDREQELRQGNLRL